MRSVMLGVGLAALLAAGTAAPEALRPDAWPQFRGSAALDGRAAAALPERLKLLWTHEAGSAVESSAAIADGAKATLIEAAASPAAAYKAWIAGSLAPQGWVTVDAGAAKALASGKSLLSAGVRAVEGPFDKGDAVRVRDETGREVARGIVRYDSADAQRIAGLRSDAIEAELGFTEGPMIHADDLAPAPVHPVAST